MQVLALISGGKDSCYSSMLCKRQGHEIVALGNLRPVLDDTDELDSYMYQTVGHQLVTAWAACTGLPLFRGRLHGSSKQQALIYDTTPGDEVEDLLDLLAYAKSKMPQLQAVSCGAIASDYQRLRVEQVCARLGLTSLAYMWHQPQAGLLTSMIEEGVHAVLCKVAAMGLKPKQHLGKSLAEMQPFLHSLRRLYQCNVCGEGGEYETLVLDCPLFIHASIVLDSWEAVHQSADAFAPVGHLHPVACHLEECQRLTGTAPPGATPDATPVCNEPPHDPGAYHLDSERMRNKAALPGVTPAVNPAAAPAATPVCTDSLRKNLHDITLVDSQPAASSQVTEQSSSSSQDSDLLAVSEKDLMQQPPDSGWAGAVVIEVPPQAFRSIAAQATDEAGPHQQSGEAAGHSMPSTHSTHSMPSMHSRHSMPAWIADVRMQCGSHYVRAVCCPVQKAVGLCNSRDTADALDCALAAIQKEVAALGLCLDIALFVHLYLADMTHFVAANAAYCRHLPAVSPSARACVQAQLLPGCPIMIEVLLPSSVQGSKSRQVLHVQSISSWAPSCIGPYSQATMLGGLVHMAGQIGLDPATMQLVAGGLQAQLLRCLKSCQDVGVACRSDLSNSLLSGTIYLSPQSASQQMPDVITNCLNSFLTGNIHQAFTQFTEKLTVTEVAISGQQLAPVEDTTTAAAGDDAISDSSSQASEITADGDIIDDYLKPPSMHRGWQPLMLVVGVAALPKGALVEVQPEACTVEVMTHIGSSHGSSDDNDDEEGCMRQAQHEQTRRTDWAARLVNHEGALQGGDSSGYCSSLISRNMYLCCQVVIDAASGSLEDNMECVFASLSDILAWEAGMTAQHVVSCTVYSHASAYASADKMLSCLQEQWLQRHECALLILHLPVWLLMTGVGTKIQLLSESHICMKLTAHQGDES